MNNFDKIIKQKAEQFDVPYNDAHWAELESTLNATKAPSNLTRNLIAAASVVTILGAAALYLNSNNDTPTPSNNKTTNYSSNISTENKEVLTNIDESPMHDFSNLILTKIMITKHS